MRAEHEEQVGEHTHTSFSHMELDVDSFNFTLDAELSPQIGGNFALSGFLGAADCRFVKSRGEGGRDSSKLYSSQLFFFFSRRRGKRLDTKSGLFFGLNGARVPDFDNCRSFAVASESARKKREGEKRNKWRAGQRAKEEERL